jgi:hypothetical protein
MRDSETLILMLIYDDKSMRELLKDKIFKNMPSIKQNYA